MGRSPTEDSPPTPITESDIKHQPCGDLLLGDLLVSNVVLAKREIILDRPHRKGWLQPSRLPAASKHNPKHALLWRPRIPYTKAFSGERSANRVRALVSSRCGRRRELGLESWREETNRALLSKSYLSERRLNEITPSTLPPKIPLHPHMAPMSLLRLLFEPFFAR
ncbi:hypothetical protein K469DRAFT_701804 [Zopfia rhizophila CBS 207.26]|uniref:Uncharacterized protein n=1 Tax=Zopfia rhizophila CBS 207.26 TaxID=1314779 RepID=A0A6A6EH34_9PEZI|nr:hypothetical protein K469DRAFT_701804 [Zopfia rhizophila CBS 207.26]